MPAYRIYDLTQQGMIRKIPFSQTVTHEGHFPFRRRSTWTQEDLTLPLCFTPNADAFNDVFEWMKYGFDDKDY